MGPSETIYIDEMVAACNGGGGPLGHPRVYLNLAPPAGPNAPIVPASLSTVQLRTRPAEARRRASRTGATSESRYAWTKSKSQPSRLIRDRVGPEPVAPAVAHAPSAAPHHVFLIDGSGFIFRAYFHALPPLFQRIGRHSGQRSCSVFSNMLAKCSSETDADHIAVVFDYSGSSFRNRTLRSI